MKSKLTVLVEEKNIRFAKRYAKEKNTSVSFLLNQFLEDLQRNSARKKNITDDKWVEKYAGIFNTGSSDLNHDFFEKNK
ncbi:MAG: DUF6364 family protein [Bacteroidota bacterium]|nr:DUF6364 family protein [Bacteroidota bacterium]